MEKKMEDVDIWNNQIGINSIDCYCADVHDWAVSKKFWESERNFGELIALMHSELSEALEGNRRGVLSDEHCKDYPNELIELADVVIRVMDYCGHKRYSLGRAIQAKMNYNKTRPDKHGKKY